MNKDYLESVIVKASNNNDICSLMLGKDCTLLLGKGKDGDGIVKDDYLVDVDATPEVMETYTGIDMSRAMHKFCIVFESIYVH